MREANDRGYDALLIEDATESYFMGFKAATLAMIHVQGGIARWTATFEHLEKAFDGCPFARGDFLTNWRDQPFEPFRDGIEIHHIQKCAPAMAILR